MTPKERAAMQQALEALEDISDHTWIGRTAALESITALREALAEPEITTLDVCGEVCARAKLCYGCGKALDEANAKLAEPYACEAGECPDKSLCAGAFQCLFKAEPVKQEQVAWMNTNGAVNKLREAGWAMNTAPVDAKAIRAYQQGRDDMKEEAASMCEKLFPFDDDRMDEAAKAIRSLK